MPVAAAGALALTALTADSTCCIDRPEPDPSDVDDDWVDIDEEGAKGDKFSVSVNPEDGFDAPSERVDSAGLGAACKASAAFDSRQIHSGESSTAWQSYPGPFALHKDVVHVA